MTFLQIRISIKVFTILWSDGIVLSFADPDGDGDVVDGNVSAHEYSGGLDQADVLEDNVEGGLEDSHLGTISFDNSNGELKQNRRIMFKMLKCQFKLYLTFFGTFLTPSHLLLTFLFNTFKDKMIKTMK